MDDYVSELTAVGLYGRVDLHQAFESGVNILYGRNGAGKTTLLHILANVLNADFERFLYLSFKSIEVKLSTGVTVNLDQQKAQGEPTTIQLRITGQSPQTLLIEQPAERHLREGRAARLRELRDMGRIVEGDSGTESETFEPPLPAAYFPAFRTMMEAWTTSMEEEAHLAPHRRHEELSKKATGFARRLFGPFVPRINYPSALDIEQRLGGEIRSAIFTVARNDEELLSESFVQIFAALAKREIQLERPERILDEIRSLYERSGDSSVQSGMTSSVYTRLQSMIGSLRFSDTPESTAVRILGVFRDALFKRAEIQEQSFLVVNRYLDSVNEFLEGKRIEKILTVKRVEPNVELQFDDGRSSNLRALSSGERQIVTLIYAATHMNEQQVVLIDEPELSLHVDWQRKLLTRMASQLGNRQIIACTHSPVIGADYELRRTELNPSENHLDDGANGES